MAGTTTLTLPTDSVQPGLILINETTFVSVSAVNINNCFSSSYQSYRLVTRIVHSTGSNVFYRLRAAGTDDASSNYYHNGPYSQGATAPASYNFNATTSWILAISSSYLNRLWTTDLFDPFTATATSGSGISTEFNGSLVGTYAGGFWHNLGSSYDGISLIRDTGTMTGSIRVYAYRNTITA